MKTFSEMGPCVIFDSDIRYVIISKSKPKPKVDQN
jgi:hypothetical protein